MRRLWLTVSLVLSVVSANAIAAGAGPDLIAGGIEAYRQAQSLTDRDARIAAFERAEQLFLQAVRDGVANADLHANAGTAALQAERLGPAILSFRRALALDPDHARSRLNLMHASALLPAWVPKPGGESALDTFFFWHRSLSGFERSGAGAICFMLAAIASAVAIRWRSRLARGIATVLAVAWVGLIASVAVDARGDRNRQAVVTADEALARASDSANAPARFADPLPGGTEVAVIELRNRWARINLANNREAWVSRGNLEMVFGHDADPDKNAQ